VVKRAAPRSVWLAVYSLLVLVCSLLLFPTVGMEGPAQSHAFTDTLPPSGLAVVRSIRNLPQEDRDLDERALKSAYISGVAFQIHWSDIEPVQGKPDWSKLDDLFAAADSSKKWVQLCIYAGFFLLRGP
jgi:hypothetical protein